RDNEAELVGILARAIQKCASIDVIVGGIIEPSGSSLARDAVALDIAQMRARRAEIAAKEARVACLDDNAPAAGRDQASGGAHAPAHAAPWRRGRDMAPVARGADAGLARVLEHARGVAQLVRAAAVTDAAARVLVVVADH